MPTDPVATSSDPQAATPTILVVEDELLIRLYVADQLRDCGFEVLEAADGAQALEVLESGKPVDLVFTDISLPGHPDGFSLTRWIRARKPALPVILTSGGHNAAKAAEVCKGEPFFEKPYDISELAKHMRRLLARDSSG
jgi:CheY-like chemotaxis protein